MMRRIYAVVGAGSLAVVSGVFAFAFAANAGNQHAFEVNEQGQTFGKLIDHPLGVEPDLIEALGDDGTLGYVLADDLDGPDFSSPEEALRWQSEQQAQSTPTRLPLYASDGRTVIGSFTLAETEIVESDSN